MHRSRTFALTTSALLLALPLGLTACGSSDKGSGAQSSAAAPTSGDQGAPSGSGSSGGGDAAGKPSKDEVKTGLVKFYGTQGVTGDKADKLAGCIVDDGYDQFSPKTLIAMRDGKPTDMDPADTASFTKVSTQCAVKTGAGSLPTSLPSAS
ncbi:hypothetical protein G9U51_12200 [Calidifontibacter sp. DB0510]|uniref:Lipoprotein n=1 Tax=Metallococcus carri TaxID=1656884 RepID=A0A967B0H8_9MICO|nr:hypothetical protein [Metallococcus carri]NHN56541.1 hypothetical protein [Metallococcus carri]NOP38840.1 hypothetical protein [Calidifontibacter sp. DB2511S]